MSDTAQHPERLLRQNVAVLFSDSTRHAYIAEAEDRDEIYTFIGAAERERRWLKGPYAYLAPNAATALLNRFNIRHDVITERELSDGALSAYRVLIVPNGGQLEEVAIEAIGNWLNEPAGERRRLIVTGLTNLPPSFLGLEHYERIEPEGYTGWRFLPGSPFADRTVWEEFYLTGYRGYPALRAVAVPGARALAELWEFTGVTTSAESATKQRIGDAIVATKQTLFISNQVLEYIGGAIQAQINVDDVRGWYYPTHYLDTIAYLLRELFLELGLADLFSTQLRSFGTYEGMVVLRHDTDVLPGEAIDLSMLEWQRANLVPATYVVLDPEISSEFSSPTTSKTWVDAAGTTNLLEIGLHNDSHVGSPPTYISARAMYEHFRDGDRRLGITSRTAGRHSAFHRHPETLDAMEYLYDRMPDLIGLCTFSILQVIEYDVQDPAVMVMGRPITYATRFNGEDWSSGAIPGWWFPHHVVISTVEERRVLRGWDSTKDSECDYPRIDELLASNNAKSERKSTRLPNPVITVQYHPQNGWTPRPDGSRGSLPWVQYLCLAAERHGFGLATKRTVYERLNDYEALLFRVSPDGEITVANSGNRPIKGLMVRVPEPVRSVIANDVACIHIVRESLFTLPPLQPGEIAQIRPSAEELDLPLIKQPNVRGLEIISALHNISTSVTEIGLRAIDASLLRLSKLTPDQRYAVRVGGETGEHWEQLVNKEGELALPVRAPGDLVVDLHLEVRPES